MARRGNNMLPNAHYHKHWQRRIKTWFNQPARKQRRRLARIAKAARVAPRPVGGLLRPIVHCPTIRYNSKLRLGHGFTLEELKAAGFNKYEAKSLGIAVDYRRTNRSVESIEVSFIFYKGHGFNMGILNGVLMPYIFQLLGLVLDSVISEIDLVFLIRVMCLTWVSLLVF
uniref:Large ribosomal subunit protein eL13 n=1 Tax=Meloidogyne incognita TaxID=6306 RepID=A0A914MV41_MELIC